MAESQYQYDALVIRTGCASAFDTLTCLRGLNTTFFQNQSFNIPFPGASNPPLYMYGPTLDYNFITDYTYRAFANGAFVRVPAIYGDGEQSPLLSLTLDKPSTKYYVLRPYQLLH